MIRIFPLAVLLLGVTFSEAHARTDPWCAAVAVALKFADQQGREAVRIELRSPTQTCTINDVDDAVGFYREPEMHINFHGKAVDVPNSCLKGFGFRLSDLQVSIGDTGVGIKILGKSLHRDTRIRAVVYTVDSDVLCNQSAE